MSWIAMSHPFLANYHHTQVLRQPRLMTLEGSGSILIGEWIIAADQIFTLVDEILISAVATPKKIRKDAEFSRISNFCGIFWGLLWFHPTSGWILMIFPVDPLLQSFIARQIPFNQPFPYIPLKSWFQENFPTFPKHLPYISHIFSKISASFWGSLGPGELPNACWKRPAAL